MNKELKEANKVIAEFMGYRVYSVNKWIPENVIQFIKNDEYISGLHFLSLDKLVPVWEKLKLKDNLVLDFENIEVFTWEEGNYPCGFRSFISKDKTIQGAACLATAQMIKELK